MAALSIVSVLIFIYQAIIESKNRILLRNSLKTCEHCSTMRERVVYILFLSAVLIPYYCFEVFSAETTLMSRKRNWKEVELDVLGIRKMMEEDEKRIRMRCLEKDVEDVSIDEKDIKEVEKYLPLYYAVVTDDSEGLAKFLDSGKFEKDTTMEWFSSAQYFKCKITPLHIAAIKGNVEIVQLLINSGMDVNVADHHHATPLHYAAEIGNHKTLKVLLEAGADSSIHVDFPNCPKNLRYPLRFTPLHLAANCNVESVKELLNFGADCGARDSLNRTCLYVAAESNREECVLYLLRNTCCKSFLSLPSTDTTSNTPLHLAVKHARLECVKEMVRLGADINHRNRSGMSPLHTICCNSTLEKSIMIEILKVLVLEGRNTDMNSAFDPSFFQNYTTEAKAFLIAYGADTDVRNVTTGFTFFEHELLHPVSTDFLYLVTKSLPALPFLQSLEIFPVIDDMPDKSTMWYSSVLPNDVTFSLVRGKSNMFVEMSSLLSQRSDSLHNYQTQLDTVVNRPLKKLFLLQQPFLDLLYNYVHEKLIDWKSRDYFIIYESHGLRLYPVNPNSPHKPEFLQLFHYLWYQKLASEPRSLMHHCRYSIRKCMGPSNIKYVNKLPLPLSLKSYLIFDYSK